MEGIGNSAYGQYHLRLSADGRGLMVHTPPHAESLAGKPRTLALEVRTDHDVTLTLSPHGDSEGPALVTLRKSEAPQTVVLQLGGEFSASEKLTLRASGQAGALVIIDRIALLPQQPASN